MIVNISKYPNSIKTYSYAVPVLVNHHHAQKHAKGEEEKSIDIVFDGITDRNAESKQKDLGDGEKRSAKHNVTDGPPILKSPEDKDKLGDDVYDDTDERPQNIDDPETDCLVECEASKLLEGSDRNEERYTKDNETGDSQELQDLSGKNSR
jgi:hypothetical protein